jgi:cysteinyl-tRNA synthetase
VTAVEYFDADNTLQTVDPASYYVADAVVPELHFVAAFAAPSTQTRPDAVRTRTLNEETNRVFRSRVVNPRWMAAMSSGCVTCAADWRRSSAMAAKYLGTAFDIHGGGLDLVFPHHENEIAQSKAAGDSFANYWLHNAWVTTAGEKMSKSLGNSLLVTEVVKRVRPVELRFDLGSAHYRSHIEFSEGALADAAAGYRRLEGFVHRAVERVGVVDRGVFCAEFVEAMDDDLGVPAALAAIYEVAREGNRALDSGDDSAVRGTVASVRAMLHVLGVDPLDPAWAGDTGASDAAHDALDALIQERLAARQAAREARDFAAADAVRDSLRAAGVLIEDTPDGPRWSLEA